MTLDGSNVVTNRSYRGDGRLLTQTYGNGLAETRTYNGLGLLASYALGSVENETYTYDPAGNLTARSGSSWSQGDTHYHYDEAGPLIAETSGTEFRESLRRRLAGRWLFFGNRTTRGWCLSDLAWNLSSWVGLAVGKRPARDNPRDNSWINEGIEDFDSGYWDEKCRKCSGD